MTSIYDTENFDLELYSYYQCDKSLLVRRGLKLACDVSDAVEI